MVLIHKQCFRCQMMWMPAVQNMLEYKQDPGQGYLLQAASVHYNSPTCWFTKYPYIGLSTCEEITPEVQADQSPVQKQKRRATPHVSVVFFSYSQKNWPFQSSFCWIFSKLILLNFRGAKHTPGCREKDSDKYISKKIIRNVMEIENHI